MTKRSLAASASKSTFTSVICGISFVCIAGIVGEQAANSAQPAAANDGRLTTELSEIQRKVKSGQITNQIFEDLQKVLDEDPHNVQAHLLLGQCYEARGYGGLAGEEYQLSDTYAPQDPPSMLAQFQRKISHRDMYAARNVLQTAQRKYPEDGNTKLMEALFYAYSNQQSKAEKVLEQLVRSTKAPPGAASTLAALRVKQARYQEAIALSDMDLQKQEDSYLSNASKGVALMQLGQYRAAAPLLKRAFSIAPLEKGIAEDCYTVLIKAGDPVGALKPALVQLSMATDHEELAQAQLTVNYLMSIVPADEADAIINNASSTLGSTNNAVKLHFLLGREFAQSGQHVRAVNQFEQGVQLNPEFAPGYFHLAQQYEALRSYRTAMHNYRLACALSPNNQLFLETTDRLAQRLSNRPDDIAWQIKDWIWKHLAKPNS